MDDRFWVNNQLLRDAEIVVVDAQWSKCAKKRSKVRKDIQSDPIYIVYIARFNKT